MNEDQKNLIELAAESRYPHVGDLYFNSVQNSRRGDFCDGALWYIEKVDSLSAKMYNALAQVLNDHESGDGVDTPTLMEIRELLQLASEAPTVKKFDNPTYPLTNPPTIK